MRGSLLVAGEGEMLRDDDPLAVAFLDDARPPGIFPGSRLALVGVDVVQDAEKPGDFAAAGELDLQVLQLMPDVFEIRAHPEGDVLLDVLEALDDSFRRRHADVILVVGDRAEEKVEIFILRPADDRADRLRDLGLLRFLMLDCLNEG